MFSSHVPVGLPEENSHSADLAIDKEDNIKMDFREHDWVIETCRCNGRQSIAVLTEVQTGHY
jgi:hypothetical protein